MLKPASICESKHNHLLKDMADVTSMMKIGDQAFLYHSNAKKLTGIAGIMEIVKEGYPDRKSYLSNVFNDD